MIRRLKQLGACNKQLVDVYKKQVRTHLEYAVPVWAGSITQYENKQIEKVQKAFCAILLGHKYESYSRALSLLRLEKLSIRRVDITKRFAHNSSRHTKHNNWFKRLQYDGPDTRSKKNKYMKVKSNKAKLLSGPISYMTSLLNI